MNTAFPLRMPCLHVLWLYSRIRQNSTTANTSQNSASGIMLKAQLWTTAWLNKHNTITLLGRKKVQIQRQMWVMLQVLWSPQLLTSSKVKTKFVQSKNSKSETALSQLIQHVMGFHLIYMELHSYCKSLCQSSMLCQLPSQKNISFNG